MLLKIFLALLLFPLFVFLGAGAIKLLWHLCGMGDWTGLGTLPWRVAVFLCLYPLGKISFSR